MRLFGLGPRSQPSLSRLGRSPGDRAGFFAELGVPAMSANDSDDELLPGVVGGEYVQLHLDLFLKAFSTILIRHYIT
jgi:hypothetical protein